MVVRGNGKTSNAQTRFDRIIETTREKTAMPKSSGPGEGAANVPVGGLSAAGSQEEMGDARLVEQARRGDDEAFAALVVRYERKLLAVLARLVRDGELARDLAQETFWRVYQRLDRFDTS